MASVKFAQYLQMVKNTKNAVQVFAFAHLECFSQRVIFTRKYVALRSRGEEKMIYETTHYLPVRTGEQRERVQNCGQTCHGKLHACLATFQFVNSVRLFLVLVLQKQHYTWRGWFKLDHQSWRTRSHRRNSNPTAKICRSNYTYAHSVSYKTAHGVRQFLRFPPLPCDSTYSMTCLRSGRRILMSVPEK